MAFVVDNEGTVEWATTMATPINHQHVTVKPCPRCGGPTVTTWIEYDRGDGWLTRIPGTYDCELGAACPSINWATPEPSVFRHSS